MRRQLLAQGQRPCHLEQVVARDSNAHGSLIAVRQRRAKHSLVGGINVGLGWVASRSPVVQFCFDDLHRQVRTLHQPDFDPRTTTCVPVVRPCDESVECCMRVGDVGLQDDARLKVEELRLGKHLHEGK